MIINKVLCYSKEIAKKNHNTLPILNLLISFIIFIFLNSILSILFNNIFMILFMILMFAWFAYLIWCSCTIANRMKTKMSGWAITTDSRIFKAVAINNGQQLFLGGMAIDGLLDQVSNTASTTNVGGLIGTVAMFGAMNRSAKYMSNPGIIAKMVEEAPNITGADVYEILNVYSIDDGKHSIVVNCDYKVLSSGRIYCKKNLNIEKSYNQYEELTRVLNSHRL